MDSANSGSMQSSSGGDEEYDSRPAFFNPNFSHLSNPISLLPHQEHSLFDANNTNNFFHNFSQSPQNPNLNSSHMNLDNLNAIGSRPFRSDLDGTKPAGSSVLLPNVPVVTSVNHRSIGGGACSSLSDQTPGVTKNPKKRTRASRRAPTTVLTTDTSNFRAMVQEFTGIPAPPFSASPFSRRLDLFGSGLRSMGSHLETVANSSLYPLRPSAQKVNQPSPFLFSSSSSSSSTSSFMNSNLVDSGTNGINTKSTSSFNTSSINYQLPSESQNLLNLQNQIFSFQSLLPSHDLKSQLPLNSLDEISMGPGQGQGQGQGQVNGNNLNSRGNSWREDGNNNDNSQDPLRSLDTCKMNNSSSDFHRERGLENVPPRGEGTVDSWICPSD